MALQNTGLFQRQIERIAAGPEIVDPRKQGRIHADLRIVARHLRRDLAFQSLDARIGMGARPVPEQRRNAREGIAGDLERHDRVGECRRLRIVGNRIDLSLVLPQSRLEGGRIVVIADLFELRQAMWPLPVDDSGVEDGRLSHALTS